MDQEKKQCFDFLLDNFHSYEPIIKTTNIKRDQLQKLIMNYLQLSCDSGFSSAIINEQDKVISAKAVIKWEDYLQAESVESSSSTIKAIEQMLGRCNQLYQPKEENLSKSIVFFMGATHQEYCGKGLMSSLNEDLIKSAKNKGFKEILADCTGPLSKKIIEKAKYQFKGKIVYSEFQFNNQKPFKEVKDGISRFALNLDII